MGDEAADRIESEPGGDACALFIVGGEIDSLAVANLVEAEMVGETVGHSILPSAERGKFGLLELRP